METPPYYLFEHAVGYGLFRVKEMEEIGQLLPQVEQSVADLTRFGSVVKLQAFAPFANTEAALANCNAVSEGILHQDLLTFLQSNLPKEKHAKTRMGVSDPKLAAAVAEALPHCQCSFSGVVPEVMRGIRLHCAALVKGLAHSSLNKAQLGLGHSYSRSKVKFNVHRVDNMVIQSIALLDQLDKDINTFGMRIREWYSYHFPELYKLVPEQYKYVRCAKLIKNRKEIDDDTSTQLTEILEDEKLANEILEAAKMSMGMDISPIDLINIERFADRMINLIEYRQRLHAYIKDRMHSCAPNLAALIGEQVGARLISHAGSLTNLAKYPASTVQILGAEKALFRALKTRGNTPKYGLLFHSTFIGRAAAKNKGRISRYLANKCSIASRIDCFMEEPVETFGEALKEQVENRLKYFESGEKTKSNLSVMKAAIEEATVVQAKVAKKRKKLAKKQKKEKQEELAVASEQQPASVENAEENAAPVKQKKKKKRKLDKEQVNEEDEESKRPKAEDPAKTEENAVVVQQETAVRTPKKKKKRSTVRCLPDELVL